MISINQILRFLRRIIFPMDVYKKNYSIGIFTGISNIKISPVDSINPVLRAGDVTDVKAVFVADPFMIKKESDIYMFFEVFNAKSRKGEIGLAKSDDWFNWQYEEIVLSEAFHLSYPYVFEWENDYYMVPETGKSGGVRLYKAIEFPKKWAYIDTIIQGGYLDASLLFHQEKWWLFTSIGDDTLYLFFSDYLRGPWQQHPMNPLISGNPHLARPGGRVLVVDGQVIRIAQDDFPKYGLKVHAFQVTELSTETYKEKELVKTLLGPSGNGWNARGMHHLDLHRISENQWVGCVDGWSESLKAYTE